MNQTFQRLNMAMGWLTFGIAALVYAMTAEPTGSLWDCGEFVSAAHKLQVVHPPGAPLFLMIGRLFAIVGETFSTNPETIAYMINLSSGICTAFLVLFIFWSTTILAKLALVGRKGEIATAGQMWAILGAGLASGLSSTFATSVWFSAVEGEVYAMSSFFTGLVLWASLRWFISEDSKADRWLVFIAYMVGLSIGVHLLSLLIIPFVALLYYYKKFTKTEKSYFPLAGTLIAGAIGSLLLIFVQYLIIPQVPAIAAFFDYTFVNSFGLGVGVGMLTFAVLLSLLLGVSIWLATLVKSYFGQLILTSLAMILIGFSTYGMIVIRANTNLPINMNAPADPYSLLSYLNREQYGDRPLFYGPHFNAQPASGDRYKDKGNVYRPVTNDKGETKYEIVDKKSEAVYNPKDMMFFPRLGHMDRINQYKSWLKHDEELEIEFRQCVIDKGGNQQACGDKNPNNPNAYKNWLLRKKRPSQADNLGFFFNYQIGHMYVRYFMWNFVGRQNAQQNFQIGRRQAGNWLSGIGFIDEFHTHQQSNLPKFISEDKSRNTYYFLPMIFGFMGMFFHFSKRPKEAFAIFALFILTGLAIIMFLNQPPQEPRERDYAFAGSIFTFCIWIGMAIPLLYETFSKSMAGSAAAVLSACIVLTAPIIMGYQNWDDHSRAGHYGARDYAINFLESCAPNAILFTYGDNDTYPLWYAQEVEGIRKDIRVVNFSLLAVDWYINQLRYKVNSSERIKMSISPDAYRGKNRNFAPFSTSAATASAMNLINLIKFIGESHPLPQYGSNAQSHSPTKSVFIPLDKAKLRANGSIPASVPDSLIADTMAFGIDGEYLIKDEIALLDIVATNAANGWERPIYFAVTCRPEKVMGLKDYLQMEGMALRIVPYKSASPTDMLMNMGRVEADIMYKNVTEKFRWGGFDKKSLFVDESYMPSVQTVQYGMMRLATELMRTEQKEKAVKVADKFFEGFPDMNFPFADSRIITRDGKTVLTQMLGVYYMAGEESKAKVHIQTLTNGLIDKQTFFVGLAGEDLTTFGEDSQMNLFLMESLLNFVSIGKDLELQKDLAAKFAPFGVALKTAPNPIPTDKLVPTDTGK
jgi:Protein of unknown function (DUF2723)